MKIAIDSGSGGSGLPSGIGVVTNELISFLQVEVKKTGGVKIDVFDFSENKEKLDSGDYDVVHYLFFHPFFVTLPEKKKTKMVVTIHDLIPLIYPKQYPSGIKGSLRLLEQKRRLKQIDAVITVSETSKKDIVRFLDVPAEKIHVTHWAPLPYFKKSDDRKKLNEIVGKYNLPNKFVLYLGDVYYSKNIPCLIEACGVAKLPLVIVGKQAKDIENNLSTDLEKLEGPQDWLRFLLGKPHPELSHYSLLKESFGKSNVQRLGYVPDDDLNAIMNLATVYCQPSFYEGFGMGIINAFACGTPVVISRTNALVEVAGGASLIADPKDPEEIANKITEILKNENTKKQLIEKGFERLKDFSWEKTAKETVKVYKLVDSN